MLVKKVRTCDFLESALSDVNLELTRDPITLTFDQAFANFRNAVNRKFPLEISSTKKTRRINQTKRANKGGKKQGAQKVI